MSTGRTERTSRPDPDDSLPRMERIKGRWHSSARCTLRCGR
jgi:hypothetical protein